MQHLITRNMAKFLVAALLLTAGCAALAPVRRPAGPWDLAALEAAPAAEWGERAGRLQPVFYAGEPLAGQPTRVFAWVGRPDAGHGPFPGVVLVHGGGGRAFADWADYWARRGYVAIAMDLAGCGPDGQRLPDGGPDQGDGAKFRPFDDASARDMWTYHTVAAVIRAHSLLCALPEVDRRRTALTGISWGGYLTCIVAGLDGRFRAAVPVYGCGFLHENSHWKDRSLAALPPEARDRWVRLFDPSQYLGGVRCPILFINGSNDFAYPLDSYRKSYGLVDPSLRTIAILIRMKHGHIWNKYKEVDAFIDSALGAADPLPRVGDMAVDGTSVSAPVAARTPLRAAALHFTADTGAWQQRNWQTLPARLDGCRIRAELPDARPIVFFVSATDARGLQASAPHVELP